MRGAQPVDSEQFIEDGFVVIRGAVPTSVTEAVLAHLEVKRGMGSAEPWRIEAWSVYDLPVLIGAITDAVRTAFDALAGRAEWHLAAQWGFPWRLPGPIEPLWHIDGDWFTHHVSSGEQILAPLFLWHDVGRDDGPTLLAPGSHRHVARLLASHEPEGGQERTSAGSFTTRSRSAKYRPPPDQRAMSTSATRSSRTRSTPSDPRRRA